MSHHRRRNTRLQKRPLQGEESLAARRNRLQPCNAQATQRRPRRGNVKPAAFEDMDGMYCPNPRCEPRQMGRGNWAYEWPHRLRLAGGSRTDIVRCRGCGTTVPRINELPKVGG